MKNANYQQALAYYEQALKEHPDDPLVQRDLGQVHFHLKEYDQAGKLLNAAASKLPKDGTTMVYLGMLAEAQDNFAGATQMYQKFLATNGSSKMAPQIRGRLLYVQDEKLRQQVADDIKKEKELAKETPPENTVGVLPFSYPAKANETLRSLAQGMAASMWYDLSTIKEIQVVERLQIKYLTDELAASEKGFSSKESGPRVGKMVQAKHLIRSSVDAPAPEKLSVQTGLINTNSAAYSPAYSADDEFGKALRVQKEMTVAVLDSLGIKIEGSKRRALKELPTKSYEAFLAFSRGVEQFDQGEFGKASAFFTEATKIDPSFTLARDFRVNSDLLVANGTDLSKFGNGIAARIRSESVTSGHGMDEVFNLATPGSDPRNQDQPTTTSGTGTATVSGSIR